MWLRWEEYVPDDLLDGFAVGDGVTAGGDSEGVFHAVSLSDSGGSDRADTFHRQAALCIRKAG